MRPQATDDNVCHAAQLIAGRAPPPLWLAPHLSKQIEQIKPYVTADAEAATRADHLLRMEIIQGHVKGLLTALNVQTLGYLQQVTRPSDTLRLLPGTLDDLSYRLSVDCDVVNTQKKKGDKSRLIPTRNHAPGVILEGHTFAAGACLGTWEVVRGRPAGDTNQQAHEAVEALWQAAGGQGGRAWLQIIRQAKANVWLLNEAKGAARVSQLLLPAAAD